MIQQFEQKNGFVTNEARRDGERIGFEMETNTGEKSMLADTNFKTNFKVSRYFVSIENLDSIIPQVEDFEDNDFL